MDKYITNVSSSCVFALYVAIEGDCSAGDGCFVTGKCGVGRLASSSACLTTSLGTISISAS